MFEMPDVIDEITLDDLYEAYGRLFQSDKRAVSIVKKP